MKPMVIFLTSFMMYFGCSTVVKNTTDHNITKSFEYLVCLEKEYTKTIYRDRLPSDEEDRMIKKDCIEYVKAIKRGI